MIGREAIAARARQHVGHREVTPNRSPLIDGWLRACGLDPEKRYAWCAAFASWCVDQHEGNGRTDVDAVAPYGVRCAGALKLGRMFPETRNPQLGDLLWFATDGKGAGHIGIVVAAIGLDEVVCVEGNSDNCIRYVRRLRSEVRFSSTRAECMPLPAASADEARAPLVHVSYEGTR
jgi:hypothetical protein